MKEDKKKSKKKGDEDSSQSAREELFLLQKRLVEMERKVNVIHRWVIFRRIYVWTKIVITILLVVGAFSAFKKYFPPFMESYNNVRSQMEQVQGVFSEGGASFEQLRDFNF